MKTQCRENCNKALSEHRVDTLRDFGISMSFFFSGLAIISENYGFGAFAWVEATATLEAKLGARKHVLLAECFFL